MDIVTYKKKNTYSGIDIGRFIFACLIPLLHINLQGSFIPIIQQYLSRLGVPFFFSVSGFFLYQSLLHNNDSFSVLKRYLKRIGTLLIVWFIIYFPLFYVTHADLRIPQIVFLTPGYLWYLTAILIAAIPFCLIRKRRVLYIFAIFFHIVGTFISDSYKWLWGGWKFYEQIFITPRNGIMFALPFMCIGELVYKYRDKKIKTIYILGAYILLYSEITFVGLHTNQNADRSMYFTLPLLCFLLLIKIVSWNPEINTSNIRRSSSAIYLMQYGIIILGVKLISLLNITQFIWLIYFSVIIIPTIICKLIGEKKLSKVIF